MQRRADRKCVTYVMSSTDAPWAVVSDTASATGPVSDTTVPGAARRQAFDERAKSTPR